MYSSAITALRSWRSVSLTYSGGVVVLSAPVVPIDAVLSVPGDERGNLGDFHNHGKSGVHTAGSYLSGEAWRLCHHLDCLRLHPVCWHQATSLCCRGVRP